MLAPNQQHQSVWVLVIVLIILTLGLSVTVVWMAIASSESWRIGDVGDGYTPRVSDDADDATNTTDEADPTAPSEDSDDTPDGSDTTDSSSASTVGAAFTRSLPTGVVDGAMPNITPIYNAFQAGPVAGLCEHVANIDDGNAATAVRVDEVTAFSFAPWGQPFRKAVENVINKRTPDLVTGCRAANGDIYLVASNISGQVAYPYKWNTSSKWLVEYQPIGGVNDGANMFVDLVPEGPMLVTGGGDGSDEGGGQWWNYYVMDDATKSTRLIEQCSLVSEVDERGGPEVSNTLSCTVWYNGEVE